MKTATIPNDSMTTTLMKVSAELSVALEDYERHLINQTATRMEYATKELYEKLIDHLGDVPENKLKGIREIITRGVLSAVNEVNTCTLIHERALGITSDKAPAETVKKSINRLQKHLLYWSEV